MAEPQLDLTKAETICRAKEKAKEGARTLMESRKDDSKVNRLHIANKGANKQNTYQDRKFSNTHNKERPKQVCKFFTKYHQWGGNFAQHGTNHAPNATLKTTRKEASYVEAIVYRLSTPRRIVTLRW